MSEPRRATRPERVALILRAGGWLLLGGLVAAVVLIAAGAFDSRPLGPLLRRDRPGIHALPPAGETFLSQPSPWPAVAPPDRFSVRLRAAYAGGETDSGYGLTLASEEGQLLVAVSPAGYVAVRETRGESPVYHLPWQTWPHVRPGMQANEIWLDVAPAGEGSEVTARVNRELLWRGALDGSPGEIRLWLGSFGGPVTVDFQSLEWHAAPGDQR